eukprot:COSAG01_NODE_3093_length_6594_cov_368.508237_6_plen_53_part_00
MRDLGLVVPVLHAAMLPAVTHVLTRTMVVTLAATTPGGGGLPISMLEKSIMD